MNRIYLSNAFSLQMVAPKDLCRVQFEAFDLSRYPLEMCYSIVGHADIAAVLGVRMNRESVILDSMEGDKMVVAQLTGGRLPEGCKTLPEGFRLQGVMVWYQPE